MVILHIDGVGGVLAGAQGELARHNEVEGDGVGAAGLEDAGHGILGVGDGHGELEEDVRGPLGDLGRDELGARDAEEGDFYGFEARVAEGGNDYLAHDGGAGCVDLLFPVLPELDGNAGLAEDGVGCLPGEGGRQGGGFEEVRHGGVCYLSCGGDTMKQI